MIIMIECIGMYLCWGLFIGSCMILAIISAGEETASIRAAYNSLSMWQKTQVFIFWELLWPIVLYKAFR